MQRDLLRELVALLRYAEPDGQNIGDFIAQHASELAQFLQADASEFRGGAYERDDVLVDRLRARLELAIQSEQHDLHERDVERAHRAAHEIARTARGFESGVVLDVDLILGDTLVDPRRRFVSLILGDASVIVPIVLLGRARILQRVYIDLACFVDEQGLHFRWKAGHGVLNLHAQEVDVGAHEALFIDLTPHLRHTPRLIGDVISTTGLGAE